jgi:hypothetical protein
MKEEERIKAFWRNTALGSVRETGSVGKQRDL